MILAISFEKRGHIVDHENKPHKSFGFVEVTETVYRRLVARSRYIAEAHEFLEGIQSTYEEKYVRQHARNAGLSGEGEIDEVRARLLERVMDNSRALIESRPESADAYAKVKAALSAWRVAPPAPAPTSPVAAEAVTLDEPSEPLVPAGSIKDEAWDRLRAAFLAQDFRETRSALAALSDDPTPSKAADLWPKVEQLLRERNMITDADL
jgi:hypothetical protein